MENSLVLMLLLQVLLIALNAVFASAEIAIISMNDAKLAKLAADGDKRAQRLARLTGQPARFLATIQVAITLSGFLGSAFAAENFSDVLVNWLVGLGVSIPAATLDTISVVLITVILSYFTLIFGELVPKRVAMRKAEPLALGISGLISAISGIFRPIVWFLTVSTNAVLRLIGIDPNEQDSEVGEEEIRMMVDVGSEKGTIDHQEKEFIQNVFEFDNITAGEIATHRTEVDLLWLDETMEEWNRTIHESRHTFYPVCGDSVDDMVGLLNAKDYFRLADKSRKTVMEKAVRPPYFVPEGVKADVLFANMKRRRSRMAVVMDEYGGVYGIITINDLLEQLVGKFADDEIAGMQEPEIRQIDDNSWRILGSAPLIEISRTLDVPLPDDEYATLTGLVFSRLGAIPRDGEEIEVEACGLRIRATEIREHQIEAAIVSRIPPVQEEQPS